MRSLVKFWRQNLIKICCFINDGDGTESNLELALKSSSFVKQSLTNSGFVINNEKFSVVPYSKYKLAMY